MTKYNYFVNSEKVTKAEMTNRLEKKCYKVVGTHEAGAFSVDVTEADKKKFNKYLRLINNNSIVIIGNDVFRRKKVSDV